MSDLSLAVVQVRPKPFDAVWFGSFRQAPEVVEWVNQVSNAVDKKAYIQVNGEPFPEDESYEDWLATAEEQEDGKNLDIYVVVPSLLLPKRAHRGDWILNTEFGYMSVLSSEDFHRLYVCVSPEEMS